jgi:hypothetical protein
MSQKNPSTDSEQMALVITPDLVILIPNSMGVHIPGSQKQARIFQPTTSQDKPLRRNSKIVPGAGSRPDVLNLSAVLIQLQMRSLPMQKNSDSGRAAQ